MQATDVVDKDIDVEDEDVDVEDEDVDSVVTEEDEDIVVVSVGKVIAGGIDTMIGAGGVDSGGGGGGGIPGFMVYMGWATDVANGYGHQLNEDVVTASGGGGAKGASSWRSIWRMVVAFGELGESLCISTSLGARADVAVTIVAENTRTTARLIAGVMTCVLQIYSAILYSE